MTDLWYYAEGEGTHGPMSIAELVPLLSRIADPRRVMIWRHGFEDWKAVEDVSEVAQQVFRPPPLRRSIPPPTPERAALTIREPAVDVEEAAQFKNVRAELTGLSGWLVLIGLGQVLGILKFVGTMGKYYGEVDAQVWTRFRTMMWGEAALNGVLFLVFVYTAVLFFRRSRLFPKFFIWQFVLSLSAPLVATLWAGFTISMATGQPMSELMSFDTQEISQMIAVVVTAAIWIPYILKSRRVRNTFTV